MTLKWVFAKCDMHWGNCAFNSVLITLNILIIRLIVSSIWYEWLYNNALLKLGLHVPGKTFEGCFHDPIFSYDDSVVNCAQFPISRIRSMILFYPPLKQVEVSKGAAFLCQLLPRLKNLLGAWKTQGGFWNKCPIFVLFRFWEFFGNIVFIDSNIVWRRAVLFHSQITDLWKFVSRPRTLYRWETILEYLFQNKRKLFYATSKILTFSWRY